VSPDADYIPPGQAIQDVVIKKERGGIAAAPN